MIFTLILLKFSCLSCSVSKVIWECCFIRHSPLCRGTCSSISWEMWSNFSILNVYFFAVWQYVDLIFAWKCWWTTKELCSFPLRLEICLLQIVQTSSGAHPSLCLVSTMGTVSTVAEQLGHDTIQSLPSIASLRMDRGVLPLAILPLWGVQWQLYLYL